MPKRDTPSAGGKPDKLMRDALMVALNREAKDAAGKKTKKLYLIADMLVDKAVDGNLQAAEMIADRVDGKPTQAVSGPDGGPIALEHAIRPPISREDWLKLYGAHNG